MFGKDVKQSQLSGEECHPAPWSVSGVRGLGWPPGSPSSSIGMAAHSSFMMTKCPFVQFILQGQIRHVTLFLDE